MKCDLCEKTAVVHEVVIKGSAKREVHLCEQHAKQAGIAAPHQPLQQILTQFVVQQQQQRPAAPRVEQRCCPACGMNFNQFRQHALLGCPECYTAFERNLAPLIERTQSGGTHHVGRTPRRSAPPSTGPMRLRLMKELDEAVAAEQYERAARLRDRLRTLDLAPAADRGGPNPAAGGSALPSGAGGEAGSEGGREHTPSPDGGRGRPSSPSGGGG
jgi:protein arginine kinase activator